MMEVGFAFIEGRGERLEERGEWGEVFYQTTFTTI